MNATTPRARSPHQDVQTPPDLISAIESKFRPIDFDLAACDASASRGHLGFFSPEQDSLKQDWTQIQDRILWLNPPFAKIAPWAAKCAEWARTQHSYGQLLLLLVPGSIDSNWWNESVRNVAKTLVLAPRVTFVGHTDPFPKPMTLNIYGTGGDDRVRYWRYK